MKRLIYQAFITVKQTFDQLSENSFITYFIGLKAGD